MSVYKFATADKTYFQIDTQQLRWEQLAGNVLDAEGKPSVAASGDLTPQGKGAHIMAGRTPKSEPGNGLAAVAVMPVPEGTTLTLYIRGNVPLQDASLPEPFDTVRVLIVPEFTVPADKPVDTPSPSLEGVDTVVATVKEAD